LEETQKVRFTLFSNTRYKTCGCCGRGRDIFFHMEVYKWETEMVIGGFDLCKECGLNFSRIFTIEVSPQRVEREVQFDGIV
jgi:hypothetical protein